MPKAEAETFYPKSRKAWRQWLQKHHAIKQSVWIVQYKKRCNMPTISWSEAVDEALCFGWIDSIARKIDEERFMQFFCKRKPTSVWSKINKEKVKRLMEEGLIMPAGLQSIETARQNGSWVILDEVEEGMIPKDLMKAFKDNKGSKKFFTGISRSSQKAILQWLVLAKQPATRQKRIDEIASLAAQQQKPKQFR